MRRSSTNDVLFRRTSWLLNFTRSGPTKRARCSRGWRTLAPTPRPTQVSQVIFYEHEGFTGRSLTAESAVADFRQSGFNNRASSAVVRGERWEVCDQAGYDGRCVVLRPGQYASLAAMGLNDRVSSVRTVNISARIDDGRYAPPPVAVRATRVPYVPEDEGDGEDVHLLRCELDGADEIEWPPEEERGWIRDVDAVEWLATEAPIARVWAWQMGMDPTGSKL